MRPVAVIPVVLIALVALGADVAQWFRAAPFWLDEEMIAINIRDRSFTQLAGPLWLGQGAPFGWLVVQRAALLMFGASELSLRFFPLVAGAATVMTALWIAMRWLHPFPAAFFVLMTSIGQWMSHYRFELKHYSADTFSALLLPALAAWVVETPEDGTVERRWTRWWIVASLTQWISYGAVLATPLCAVLLAGAIYRRLGLRAVARFAVAAVVWLLSFGVHYGLSLQYTDNSRFLRDYWAGHVMPHGLDAAGVVAWIGKRLERLASNPGGSEWGVAFWAAALFGFAVTRRRLLGAMFASVPLAGFLLAAIRQVPLDDRLALWIVPSLYAGIALLLDAGVTLMRRPWERPRLAMAFGSVMTAAAVVVGSQVIVRGYRHLDVGVPAVSNHDLDDRRAVAWLKARHRAGDVIVTTQLGWPAIWWYGNLSIRHHAIGRELPDGTLMLAASHERARPHCRQQLQAALEGRTRVLLYAGFPDEGSSFYDAFVAALEPNGIVIDFARFGATSLVAVVELFTPDAVFAKGPALASVEAPASRGCVTLRPARRW
ncbi:MAG TPA: hypothetical protein VGD94_01910 [Vicinamibacterales bacterium]